MDIRLFAETRFYSKTVEKFVMEAKEKMRSDIDWNFYCDANYTEDQWMLLDKFENLARSAVEIGAPFVFQCLESGDLLT